MLRRIEPLVSLLAPFRPVLSLAVLAVVAVLGAAGVSTAAGSHVRSSQTAACSKATASKAMTRYRIGVVPGQPRTPVYQVLCGAFLGPGTRAMVGSIAIPSCGGSVGWAVFRYANGSWQLVKRVKHGAFLDAVGSDIRETLGVLAPGDAHCFPSSVRYHFWHWNGHRLVAGPWSRALSYNPVVSPDGNLYCSFSIVTYPNVEAHCASVSPVHTARLLLDGTVTTCDGSSSCLNDVDRARAHVVPYGQTDEWNDFHCLSESKGMTCTVIGGKAAGKGFVINSSGVTRVSQPARALRSRRAATIAGVTGTTGSDSHPGRARIVIANADGSGRRILANGEWSAISPDGTRVAVTDWDEVNHAFVRPRFSVFPSSGGAPTFTLATDCLGVVWSPDSKKLACSEGDMPSRLVVIDAATGSITTIATGNYDLASFSPDSTRLVYVQRATADTVGLTGALTVVDLATHSRRVLREAAARPVWGPKAIAFSTVVSRPHYDVLNVALIQPDGSGFRQLTNIRPRTYFFALYPVAWSADGTRLLGGIHGQDAWTEREAYAIDPASGRFRLIAHSLMPTAISRDGRFVVGQTGDAECCGFKYSNVARVAWGGGKKHVLLAHAMAASFNG
jgi:hypothetical protein